MVLYMTFGSHKITSKILKASKTRELILNVYADLASPGVLKSLLFGGSETADLGLRGTGWHGLTSMNAGAKLRCTFTHWAGLRYFGGAAGRIYYYCVRFITPAGQDRQ